MKLNLVLIGSIIILAFGCWFLNNQRVKEKTTRIEKESILQSKETLFKNELEQNASKVITWSLKYDELKDANKRALNGMASDYDKKLAEAYNRIELVEKKDKRVKEYYESLLSSRDTFYQTLPSNCMLKPITSKYINIDFIYQDSIVGVAYKYHTGQNIVVVLSTKLKKNGKKHWPDWGWLPWVGWDANKSTWTVEDPSATITNQIAIEFKK